MARTEVLSNLIKTISTNLKGLGYEYRQRLGWCRYNLRVFKNRKIYELQEFLNREPLARQMVGKGLFIVYTGVVINTIFYNYTHEFSIFSVLSFGCMMYVLRYELPHILKELRGRK